MHNLEFKLTLTFYIYYLYCFIFYDENNPINIIGLLFNPENPWMIGKGGLLILHRIIINNKCLIILKSQIMYC